MRPADGRRGAPPPPLRQHAGRAGQNFSPVDPAPRLEILDALPEHEGETTPRLTTAEIAAKIGKHPSTIEQMLRALERDGLVDCRHGATARTWARTHLPIPETFTSTAAVRFGGTHDDRALRAALGIPLSPPAPRGRVTVVKAK